MQRNGSISKHKDSKLNRDDNARDRGSYCSRRIRENMAMTPTTTTQEANGLSWGEFMAVWTLLLTLHGLCAVYLLAMARLYFFMEDPLIIYLANLLALPEDRHFRLFGIIVGTLGGLHAFQLLLHIMSSIQDRAPVVWPRTVVTKKIFAFVRRQTRKKIEEAAARKRPSLKRTLSTLESVLSIEGDHFALVFVLRKAVEVGTQIIQCHRFSTLISRDWINHAHVAMVVTNAWITSLFSHLILASDFRSPAKVISVGGNKVLKNVSSMRERTWCVAIDGVLTTISTLVLPLAIFVPWALRFDATEWTFPVEILYDDTLYTRLVYENQTIFALSFFDGLVKMVPHVSLLLCLTSVSLILERNPPRPTSPRRTSPIKSVLVSPIVAPQKVPFVRPRVRRTKFAAGMKLMQDIMASLVFLLAGAVVLVLHFRADHFIVHADESTTGMCVQSIRPWFARNVSCVVVKYNCYRQGVATPSPDALDNLQRDALASLIFDHCPAFEMPPSIREFPNLLGLELWNVTLVSWGVDAALNADLHPKMSFLILVQVNMTELPEGVLQAPLPGQLGDIEIAQTNLTTIPEEVINAWNNVGVIYVEHTPLHEFPSVLFRLRAYSISLVNDGIKELPNDLFTSDDYQNYYYILVFSYNPLQTFPSDAKSDLVINELYLAHTELTVLPQWASTEVGKLTTLGGSPICKESSTWMDESSDCFDDAAGGGYYPLAFMKKIRQL